MSVTLHGLQQAAAAEIHATTQIDFAVLDISLGFESSLDFAGALRLAGVPFIFASGHGEHPLKNDRHIAELTVSKPYDMDYLSVAVANTLARKK